MVDMKRTILILQLGVFLTLLLFFAPFTPDDAYIYFTGARQLAEGNLPTTSADIPTNAFSSYLWLILLTPSFWLNIPPAVWAKIFGVVFLLLSALMMKRILVKLRFEGEERTASICGASILVFPPFVANAVNGLETTMAMFALLLMLYLIVRDYKSKRLSFGTGLAFSFYFISRPDSVANILPAVFFLIFIFATNRVDKSGWWKFMMGLIPAIAVVVCLYSIYGNVLPTSASAKTDFWGSLLDPGFYKVVMMRFGRAFAPDPLLYLVLFSTVYMLAINRREPLYYLLTAFSFSLVVVRLTVIEWMGIHRLYAPSIAVALVVFYIFLKEFLDRRGMLISCALISLGLLSGASYWHDNVSLNYAGPNWPPKELGRIIADHKKPDSWLIQADMGAVPYFAEIPAIDGHDRPICNSWLAKHPGDMDYVLDRHLDFVILAKSDIVGRSRDQFEMMRKIDESDWFELKYRKVAVARWRPEIHVNRPYANDVIPGRYLHLYVSDRIETLPDSAVLILR